MKRVNTRIACVVALLLVGLFLSACDVSKEKSIKASPDWSRGVNLGMTTVNNPVGFDLSEDGKYIHLAWPTLQGKDERLQYVRLDQHGDVVLNTTLPIPTNKPTFSFPTTIPSTIPKS